VTSREANGPRGLGTEPHREYTSRAKKASLGGVIEGREKEGLIKSQRTSPNRNPRKNLISWAGKNFGTNIGKKIPKANTAPPGGPAPLDQRDNSCGRGPGKKRVSKRKKVLGSKKPRLDRIGWATVKKKNKSHVTH